MLAIRHDWWLTFGMTCLAFVTKSLESGKKVMFIMRNVIFVWQVWPLLQIKLMLGIQSINGIKKRLTHSFKIMLKICIKLSIEFVVSDLFLGNSITKKMAIKPHRCHIKDVNFEITPHVICALLLFITAALCAIQKGQNGNERANVVIKGSGAARSTYSAWDKAGILKKSADKLNEHEAEARLNSTPRLWHQYEMVTQHSAFMSQLCNVDRKKNKTRMRTAAWFQHDDFIIFLNICSKILAEHLSV